MKTTITNYLTYGCSKKFPKPRNIIESDILFHEAKSELLKITNSVIEDNITNPDNTIFQCSGGFDSSLIVSKYKNISTFSTCQTTKSDYKYSIMTSEYFKTNHEFVSEENLTKDVSIEKMLIEMNKIHSLPRGYINDLGLYLFVKKIKDKTDIIAGGEGIELMYLGYLTMYIDSLYSAIWNKEYDIEKAKKYMDEKTILKNTTNIDPVRLMKLRKNPATKNKDYFSLMDWWSTGFTNKEVNLLGLEIKEHKQFNYFNFINYINDWYGSEFYFDRRLEYADHFNLKWISPYLDKRFVDFSLSLPIEMRNCCGQIKYIMYESLGHMLPRFIIDRPKEGLVLSFDFYLSRKNEILKLTDKYLNNPVAKICNYLEFSEISKIINQFKIQFDFDYLRKVWMLLNLEMWLLTR